MLHHKIICGVLNSGKILSQSGKLRPSCQIKKLIKERILRSDFTYSKVFSPILTFNKPWA